MAATARSSPAAASRWPTRGVQSCANLRFGGLLSGPDADDGRWDALLGGRPFHIRNYF
jgi:hypothetical protein